MRITYGFYPRLPSHAYSGILIAPKHPQFVIGAIALTRVHGVWREQVPAGTVDFAQFDLHVRAARPPASCNT